MSKWVLLLAIGLVFACNQSNQETSDTAALAEEEIADTAQSALPLADEASLDQYLAQYAPVDMHYDASGLASNQKALLKKLVEAAKVVDQLFWMQTSKEGLKYQSELKDADPNTKRGKAYRLLMRNGGPYELLNDYATFIGDTPYYAGGEVYPTGMTAEQFDQVVAGLGEEERAAFMNPYTVIRTKGDTQFQAVPYHQAYELQVNELAGLLREAAALAENESFKKYLNLKADAVLSDKYFDADVAWIDMSGNAFDLVLGPFETYSDGIKGIKAKYEAYVEIVDKEGSADLAKYVQHLQAMEANLPVDEVYKSEVSGLTAKFVIVQGIYRGGEAGVGYQAVAANLPNDPEVHAKKGTVKTFWKNMFKARFNEIIKPVSMELIAEDQQQYLSDKGFFQFVLMHEICHAIGPRTVKVGPNKGMAANASIGPLYNGLEEAKADIVGLLSLAYLMDKGVEDAAREKEFYVSYLGSLFRSVRFGTQQAHGKAAAVAIKYLRDQGAIEFNAESGRWSVVQDNFRQGVRNLSRELLMLLGDGDTQKVAAFFDHWMPFSGDLSASLDKVKDLPIDVLPKYHIQWD